MYKQQKQRENNKQQKTHNTQHTTQSDNHSIQCLTPKQMDVERMLQRQVSNDSVLSQQSSKSDRVTDHVGYVYKNYFFWKSFLYCIHKCVCTKKQQTKKITKNMKVGYQFM